MKILNLKEIMKSHKEARQKKRNPSLGSQKIRKKVSIANISNFVSFVQGSNV